MDALQVAALLGVVFGAGTYYAIRVVITYDRQKGLGDLARRRSVYFSVTAGLVVAVLTFFLAR